MSPFDKLDDREVANLFALLVGIICRRTEKSVSQAIPLDQYRIVNEKYVFGELYGFPYPAAARACLGHVAVWAAKHSIPNEKILCFFENGAKHKGQIAWIAERDGFKAPTFGEKSDIIPLQCGDLMAWCHNLYLTLGGRVPTRYGRALERLAKHSHEWGLMDLQDPDRIPTIFGIQRRDPSINYQHKIVRTAKGQKGTRTLSA